MPDRHRARTETSAGGVIIRRIGGIPHVLLIRDSYQHWGFPKGHVEPGESPADAALREAAEETGLTGLTLGPPLQTIDWWFRLRGVLIHKFCHFFLLESSHGEPAPQTDEGITACRWVPVSEAEGLIVYDNAREVLRRAAEELHAGGAAG